VPIVFLLGLDEARYILADSGAKIVVTAPESPGKVEGWTGTVVLVGGGAGATPGTSCSPVDPTRFPPSSARTTSSP
jgi:hypothetical protein